MMTQHDLLGSKRDYEYEYTTWNCTQHFTLYLHSAICIIDKDKDINAILSFLSR